jgi:type I restriction enzyme R subunit
MYVDKLLSGIKAVQTLSRLNRAHPQKHDVFVLDFMNNSETITEAFADYYRTTILSEETDPNKLHDLKMMLDGHQVQRADTSRRGASGLLARGRRKL